MDNNFFNFFFKLITITSHLFALAVITIFSVAYANGWILALGVPLYLLTSLFFYILKEAEKQN